MTKKLKYFIHSKSLEFAVAKTRQNLKLESTYHRGKSKVNVLKVATCGNIINSTMKMLEQEDQGTEKSGGPRYYAHTKRLVFKLKGNPTHPLP